MVKISSGKYPWIFQRDQRKRGGFSCFVLHRRTIAKLFKINTNTLMAFVRKFRSLDFSPLNFAFKTRKGMALSSTVYVYFTSRPNFDSLRDDLLKMSFTVVCLAAPVIVRWRKEMKHFFFLENKGKERPARTPQEAFVVASYYRLQIILLLSQAYLLRDFPYL